MELGENCFLKKYILLLYNMWLGSLSSRNQIELGLAPSSFHLLNVRIMALMLISLTHKNGGNSSCLTGLFLCIRPLNYVTFLFCRFPSSCLWGASAQRAILITAVFFKVNFISCSTKMNE